MALYKLTDRQLMQLHESEFMVPDSAASLWPPMKMKGIQSPSASIHDMRGLEGGRTMPLLLTPPAVHRCNYEPTTIRGFLTRMQFSKCTASTYSYGEERI